MSSHPDDNQTSPSTSTSHEAFMRLLVEHEPRLRSYLRGLLPTWQDVEEVTQEACLVAWRKFEDFQTNSSFGGWLLTIARFEALKYRRKIARTALVFSEDVWELLADEAHRTASTDTNRSQLHQRHLEDCLQKLDAAQRELMLKVHAPGVVIRDLALHSGKSEQAFYKLIQRLRVVLLKCVSSAMQREFA